MQAQQESNLGGRTPSPRISLIPPSNLPTPPAPASPAVAAPPAPVAETAGLAHDAGNLLAALGLYSQLLSVPGVLRPEHQHYATELRLIADRSSQLIHRLLAAPGSAQETPAPAQAQHAALPPNLLRRRNSRSTDTVPFTRDHAATLINLAPVLESIAAGAATVTVHCPTVLPPLNFHPEIIERIIVNLVRNAAEAIRIQQAGNPSLVRTHPGKIRVILGVVEGKLKLTVEDNGPGMPQTNVNAYMQPSPLPTGAVHGIGHRIVHELATASEGALDIHVLPGQGTSFSITWPIPTPQAAEPCTSEGNLTSTIA